MCLRGIENLDPNRVRLASGKPCSEMRCPALVVAIDVAERGCYSYTNGQFWSTMRRTLPQPIATLVLLRDFLAETGSGCCAERHRNWLRYAHTTELVFPHESMLSSSSRRGGPGSINFNLLPKVYAFVCKQVAMMEGDEWLHPHLLHHVTLGSTQCTWRTHKASWPRQLSRCARTCPNREGKSFLLLGAS